MLVNVKHISLETRGRILSVLDREDILVDDQDKDATMNEEPDLLQSQDYPSMFQSQTEETLLHCTLCEYLSRSKPDFEHHMLNHPLCDVCKKPFETARTLLTHIHEMHPVSTVKCNTCQKEIKEVDMEEHKKEHEIFANLKKGLDIGQQNQLNK